MKVAKAIAECLRDAGIRYVFAISGGASLWLIHGIADTEGIDFICPQTEQAAGFMADAYARFTGMGCAIATSGPGATNLITAIAASYYDSVPVLYLTGNVTRARMSGDSGVRQTGFQETPIVEMVRAVTKKAVLVMEPGAVIPELLALIELAKAGRPGPVLLDCPDDIQRASV